MKTLLFYFAMAGGLALADTASPTPSLAPTMTLAPVPAPASPGQPATPDATPTTGYPAARYEALWTKSPFAVATSDEATQTTSDYMLYGVSNIGGVFYASVVERASQEHFLVSSDAPSRGMTLTSVTHSDGGDTFALVQKDGQSLTLKLEQAPAAQPGGVVAGLQPNPGQIVTPQITMPGSNPTFPNGRPRFRRNLIFPPPRPGVQPQQPVPQATPQAAPVQPPPPPPQ